MKITKLKLCEHLINEAIISFFKESSIFVIHLCGNAAHRSLCDLNKKDFSEQIDFVSIIVKDLNLNTAGQKLLHQKFYAAYDFMRHADKPDKNIDSEIDINPEFTELVIYNSIQLYNKLSRNYSEEMLVFMIWLKLKHPEYFLSSKPDFDELIKHFTTPDSHLNPDKKSSYLEFITRLKSLTR